MNRRLFMLGAGFASLGARQLVGQTITLSDGSIRNILVHRIDVEKRSVGIAVGILNRGRKRVTTYGRLDLGNSRSISPTTLFEIGSVTKVFSALLLADMERRGEVGFHDPVDRYLPTGFSVPKRNGR